MISFSAEPIRNEQKKLEKFGLRVIRICNTDIDNNLPGVSEFITREVVLSLPSSDEEGGAAQAVTEGEITKVTSKE